MPMPRCGRTRTRTSIVALASVVVALGILVPAERAAFAQQPRSAAPKKRDKKKEDQEKKDAEAAAAAEEERKKKEEEEAKKKQAAATTAPPKEEKKPFDDTVEAERAVYISGDIAFTRADLGTIVDNTGFDRTAANGTMWGFSGGYRVRDLRAGLRWRIYDTTQFTLWAFSLQAGYSMKFRPVTPIFNGHIGYVFSQSLEPSLYPSAIPEGTVLPPKVDVKGLIVGADVNASYWVTKWFRMGAFIGFDVMFLSRGQTDVPRSITGAPPVEITSQPIYTESGFGMGFNVMLGARIAFDLGLE